jgi:hypothetical protein
MNLDRNNIITILQESPRQYQNLLPRFHDVGLSWVDVAKLCLKIDPNCIDMFSLAERREVAAFALRLGVLPQMTNCYGGQIYATVYKIGVVILKAVMKVSYGVQDVFRYIFQFFSDEEMAGCNLVRIKYQLPFVWRHYRLEHVCVYLRVLHVVSMKGSMPFY